MTHKILLSAPVPWIGDLGLGDWGLGLDKKGHAKTNVILDRFCEDEWPEWGVGGVPDGSKAGEVHTSWVTPKSNLPMWECSGVSPCRRCWSVQHGASPPGLGLHRAHWDNREQDRGVGGPFASPLWTSSKCQECEVGHRVGLYLYKTLEFSMSQTIFSFTKLHKTCFILICSFCFLGMSYQWTLDTARNWR